MSRKGRRCITPEYRSYNSQSLLPVETEMWKDRMEDIVMNSSVLSPISSSKANALGSKIPTPLSLTPMKMVDTPNKSALGSQRTINKQPILEPSNTDKDEIAWEEGPSSPFVSEVVEDKENAHASVASTTTISTPRTTSAMMEVIPRDLDATGVDPTPTLTRHRTPFKIAEDETCKFSARRSVRKTATSPAKPSVSRNLTRDSQESITVSSHSSFESQRTQRISSFGTAIATEIGDMTINEDAYMDDTCFSTFSEIPDMTTFAKLGQRSPTKAILFDQPTPRPSMFGTPGTSRSRMTDRSPSPTPRGNANGLPQYQDSSDTTNLLLDFTQQFEALSTSQRQSSPTRRSPTKLSSDTHLLSYLNNQRSPVRGSQNPSTPRASNNNILNLLDFELPPAPTPRSVPTITVREMESLKSKYSSELSSIRATLSGREAEVEALKRAVSDAERRVGDATEASREERSKRECVEKEKEEWERRGRDFEEVLRKVKEEVIGVEKERADMVSRLEEAEERARDADARAADAEARAIEAATKVVDTQAISNSDQQGPVFTAEQVQKQIDEKVHTLSTELHAIYKKKHVTKVAGLKKGFEAKSKEKTAELELRIEELEHKNDELQVKLDGTLSGVLPTDLACKLSLAQDYDLEQRDKDTKKLEEQHAEIEQQKAELVGREEELRTVRAEFAMLMQDLEQERVEKGELVAAVDEMLALQADFSTVNPGVGTAVEDFRKSISSAGITGANRPSGLRAPGGFGFGGSKIAAPGLSRSTSGGKSRMMSNIERMASGRPLE